MELLRSSSSSKRKRKKSRKRRLLAFLFLVADVPVHTQLLIQQAKVYMNMTAECWTFLLCHRDRYAQFPPVQITGDSTGAVLGKGCWRTRCGATTGA